MVEGGEQVPQKMPKPDQEPAGGRTSALSSALGAGSALSSKPKFGSKPKLGVSTSKPSLKASINSQQPITSAVEQIETTSNQQPSALKNSRYEPSQSVEVAPAATTAAPAATTAAQPPAQPPAQPEPAPAESSTKPLSFLERSRLARKQAAGGEAPQPNAAS